MPTCFTAILLVREKADGDTTPTQRRIGSSGVKLRASVGILAFHIETEGWLFSRNGRDDHAATDCGSMGYGRERAGKYVYRYRATEETVSEHRFGDGSTVD